MKTHPHHRGLHQPTAVTPALYSQATVAQTAVKPNANVTEDGIDFTPHIAETAYFIAMQRGFSGGDPLQDWLEAERRVFSGASPANH